MSTPAYLGAAAQPQPTGGDGLLARISSYLSGGGTPMYRGAGQPASLSTGGLLRPTTPMYAPAPTQEQVAQANAEAQACAQGETTACPIDAEALASGHIAIVIPRGT